MPPPSGAEAPPEVPQKMRRTEDKTLLAPKEREPRGRPTRDFLEKLPPEKRRQVLDALRAVWQDEDVKAAREELKQASNSYRRTVRKAIEETDPSVRDSVRPILEQLLREGINPAAWAELDRKKGGGPPPDQRPDPRQSMPRFLNLLGIGPETMASLSPEDRKRLGKLRDHVMNDERVKAAAAKIPPVPEPPPGRAAAMRDLRRIARDVAEKADPKIKEILQQAGEPQHAPADGEDNP